MRIRFSAFGILLVAGFGLTGCRGTADPWANVAQNVRLNDVAFGNGVFVAVGDINDRSQFIETSADGMTWKVQQSNDIPTQRDNAFFGVGYGGAGFVASDSVNDLFASRDGSNWAAVTPQPIGNIGFDPVTEIDWDGREYLMPVRLGGGVQYVYTSADGTAWTGKTVAPGPAVVGVGSFVQVAGTWYAVDREQNIATSTDLLNWTEVSIPFANQRVMKLIYANGQFVAVGAGGLIALSSDGAHWTDASDPTVNQQFLFGVAWNGSAYVAIGDKTVLHSQNGLVWQKVDYSNLVPSVTIFGSIAAAPNGAFVIVGGAAVGGQGGAVDITSLDGVNWSAGHP